MKLARVLTHRECISNIELFRSLCAEHVCTSVFALRVEDFLHAHDCLKPNFMVLLCEIFHNVETKIHSQGTYVDMSTSSNEESVPRKQVGGNKSLLLSKRSRKQFAKFEMQRELPSNTGTWNFLKHDFVLFILIISHN